MKKRTFTLIEIAVAVALFALIGTIVAGSLAAFQRTYDKVARLSQKLDRNRALDRIAEHFSNAIPFVWPNAGEDDEEQLVFAGSADELWFTTRRRAGADGRGAILFLRLYVDNDNRLQCDYRDLPFLPWVELERQTYRTETIAEGVESLSFVYGTYDDNDEIDWIDDWDQDDEDYRDVLPAAIRMTVTFTNGESVTYLRRTAGIAAFSGLAVH